MRLYSFTLEPAQFCTKHRLYAPPLYSTDKLPCQSRSPSLVATVRCTRRDFCTILHIFLHCKAVLNKSDTAMYSYWVYTIEVPCQNRSPSLVTTVILYTRQDFVLWTCQHCQHAAHITQNNIHFVFIVHFSLYTFCMEHCTLHFA